jgi:hypothetical protein
MRKLHLACLIGAAILVGAVVLTAPRAKESMFSINNLSAENEAISSIVANGIVTQLSPPVKAPRGTYGFRSGATGSFRHNGADNSILKIQSQNKNLGACVLDLSTSKCLYILSITKDNKFSCHCDSYGDFN